MDFPCVPKEPIFDTYGDFSLPAKNVIAKSTNRKKCLTNICDKKLKISYECTNKFFLPNIYKKILDKYFINYYNITSHCIVDFNTLYFILFYYIREKRWDIR